MKPLIHLGVVLLAALAMGACSSGKSMLAGKATAEGLQLREYCKRNALRGSKVQSADSLLKVAQASLQSGESAEAYWQADKATLLYRLAIQEAARDGAKAKLVSEKALLSEEADQLQTFRQIYDEVKTMRTP